MFTIFKRLRKNLIKERKINSYFKYAIGEIILVMFGILLALQVNNWNNFRKDRVSENELLNNLREELIFNLEELNKSRESYGYIQMANTELIKYTKPNPVLDTLINYEPFIAALTISEVYNYKDGILQSAINSGKLDLITNNVLRSKISQLPGKLDVVQAYENALREMNILKNMDMLKTNASIVEAMRSAGFGFEVLKKIKPSEFKPDYKLLFSNIDFENSLMINLAVIDVILKSYEELENELKKLLKIIETEIK